MSDVPNLFGLVPKAKRKKAAEASNGSVHRLIMLWVSLFTQRFGEKPVVTPRDGATLKKLLGQSDEGTVSKRLEQYLALDDTYLHDAGYPLTLLPGAWNRLIAQKASAPSQNRVPDVEATSAYLRSLRRR